MAVTTVTTTMAAGVNYTVVTDTSADWPSVPNSTYFYDKADKLVHYKDGSGTVLEIFAAGGGGLTYFTEAQNTAAPNATVPVDSLTAVSAATNADAAIVPKGTGALLAAIPNNAAGGGNKRGVNAVDLQTSRSTATQVASGDNAVIAGGQNNTASGPLATVGGGTTNISSNYRTTVSGGISNTASGIHATVGGGYNNVSSGEASFTVGEANTASASRAVAIGQSNTASGTNATVIGNSSTANNTYAMALSNNAIASGIYSFAFGGRARSSGYGAVAFGGYPYVDTTASADNAIAIGAGNTASAQFGTAVGGYGNVASGVASYASGSQANTFGIYGRQSRGYLNTVSGDCQKSEWYLSKRTTDATATTLVIGGGTFLPQAQILLQNNNAFRFKGTIIGKQSGSTNTSAWDVDGLIVRGTTAASTSVVVGNVNLVSNIPGWGTPTVTADTTNGCLTVQVTGLGATNIQWTASIETTEVIYA